jgi:hypothetical protein
MLLQDMWYLQFKLILSSMRWIFVPETMALIQAVSNILYLVTLIRVVSYFPVHSGCNKGCFLCTIPFLTSVILMRTVFIRSCLCPGRFTPRERAPSTHCIGGWMDTEADLDEIEKRKFSTLPRLELRPLRRPAYS